MRQLRRVLCMLGFHKWECVGDFAFCSRPDCPKVEWFTGEWSWDLDVCNTRKYYHFIDVNE